MFITLSAEHIPLLIHTGSGGKTTARRARRKLPHILGSFVVFVEFVEEM